MTEVFFTSLNRLFMCALTPISMVSLLWHRSSRRGNIFAFYYLISPSWCVFIIYHYQNIVKRERVNTFSSNFFLIQYIIFIFTERCSTLLFLLGNFVWGQLCLVILKLNHGWVDFFGQAFASSFFPTSIIYSLTCTLYLPHCVSLKLCQTDT